MRTAGFSLSPALMCASILVSLYKYVYARREWGLKPFEVCSGIGTYGMTEVVPCYKSAKGVQNASFTASWMEHGPPIWYSGLKRAFAPPEPKLLANVSVEWPNSGSVRCC